MGGDRGQPRTAPQLHPSPSGGPDLPRSGSSGADSDLASMVMEPRRNNDQRIAVICVDPSAVAGFQVFNPNDWQGDSKAVVLSCSTELSILQYGVNGITEICRSPKERCQPHFENLKRQWGDPTRSLPKTICYAQVPELHVLIEAFFSGIKSLLDLIVQLLSTEKIVGTAVNGFHRAGPIYGGRVLNALGGNSCAGNKEIADRLKELVADHKQRWIDEVISSRDLLIHPTKGAHQLMFELRLAIRDGLLVYEDAVPPSVGDQTVDRYSAAQLENTKHFAQAFIAALRVKE